MVFIGIDLPRDIFTQGLEQCLVCLGVVLSAGAPHLSPHGMLLIGVAAANRA